MPDQFDPDFPAHYRKLPEAVADALIQYETGGICHYGQTCGLCDCGKADETPEQTQTRDAMELDRARAVLAAVPEAQPATLKPIREQHSERERGPLAGYCRACGYASPCPTVRLCGEVEAAAKGGE